MPAREAETKRHARCAAGVGGVTSSNFLYTGCDIIGLWFLNDATDSTATYRH